MNSSAAALLALRAFRSSNNNSWTVSRSLVTTSKQSSKTGSSTASSGGINTDSKKMDPPSNVFKQVDSSALGPGASKQSDYKNPEYFSYHNMSYTDMELVMAKSRVPQPTNKK